MGYDSVNVVFRKVLETEMRLRQHILTERRGKDVNETEAFKLLETKCKKSWDYFLKTQKSILRGVNFRGEYYLIDPKKSERVSANTLNYYTILLDGHPKWKSYPKRSQSIICTNVKSKTSNYGDSTYRVFPYDGSNIGVCPTPDIWDSFQKGMPLVRNLNTFNLDLEDLYDEIMFGDLSSLDSYKTWMKELRVISDEMKLKYAAVTSEGMPEDFYGNGLVKSWNNKGHLDEWIAQALDPTKNGFSHTNDIKKALSNNKAKEMWTDGKSLMVDFQRAHYIRLERIE